MCLSATLRQLWNVPKPWKNWHRFTAVTWSLWLPNWVCCCWEPLVRRTRAGRVWENQAETRSIYLGAYPFDLDDHALMSDIHADYDLIRATLQTGQLLSGRLGQWIQPRTKGAGGNAPKTRAFYARTDLVARLVD